MKLFNFPLATFHWLRRQYDTIVYFPAVVNDIEDEVPFASMQYIADEASKALLWHMETAPHWKNYLTEKQMAQQAVAVAWRNVKEA